MMDFWLAVKVIALGIVEGLTEFLPISSTGHLIVAGDLLRYEGESADTFFVAIQIGAILAVMWHYRSRIFSILRHLFSNGPDMRLAVNTVVAFFPAAIIGLTVAGLVKTYLFHPVTVAVALIIGGMIILWVEKRQTGKQTMVRITSMDDMNWKDSLGVGLMQCFALIPGMSRSGSTIIGGMLLGLSRKAATEFSFFLAIPTIIGAGVYDLWKSREVLSVEVLPEFALGTIVSFISAIFVVRWLLRYVSINDFCVFGWYRIGFGLIVLLWSLL